MCGTCDIPLPNLAIMVDMHVLIRVFLIVG
jgi:hypothetical protein